MDILRFELVFDLRLLSRHTDGHYAQRDNMLRQAKHLLHHLRTVHIGMQTRTYGALSH